MARPLFLALLIATTVGLVSMLGLLGAAVLFDGQFSSAPAQHGGGLELSHVLERHALRQSAAGNFTNVTCSAQRNPTSQCKDLKEWLLPSGSLEIDDQIDAWKELLCDNCRVKIGRDFLCAMLVSELEVCNADRITQDNETLATDPMKACFADCVLINLDDASCNLTQAEKFNCSLVAAEAPFSCIENVNVPLSSGKDVCKKTAFLFRRSSNVPNWVWIFIFGVGISLCILISLGITIIILGRYGYLNPCNWCECCPKYNDL